VYCDLVIDMDNKFTGFLDYDLYSFNDLPRAITADNTRAEIQ